MLLYTISNGKWSSNNVKIDTRDFQRKNSYKITINNQEQKSIADYEANGTVCHENHSRHDLDK